MTTPATAVRPGGSGLAIIGDAHGVLLAGPAPNDGPESLAAMDARIGPMPHIDVADLVDQLTDSGLCGRGGGQFPFARKLQAVLAAGPSGRGVAPVVVNISESEPASGKDRALVRFRPHLVLDGAALAAKVIGAGDAVLHLHDGDVPSARALRAALQERAPSSRCDPTWRVSAGPARYVSGEASAVLSSVAGGRGLPVWSPVPAAVCGMEGRPTLISNAETFAQVAMIARIGARQWQRRGPTPWSGPVLLTVHGAVQRPGQVVEILAPTTVGRVLEQAGGLRHPPAAVLIGGYAGTWVPGDLAWRLHLDRADLASAGASIGCGLVAALPADVCAVAETARLISWLADEGAGQCGPCALGLPRMGRSAEAMRLGRRGAAETLLRLADRVDRRGGCRHPDGVARLARTAVQTFAAEIEDHRRGRCERRPTRLLPLPEPAPA